MKYINTPDQVRCLAKELRRIADTEELLQPDCEQLRVAADELETLVPVSASSISK